VLTLLLTQPAGRPLRTPPPPPTPGVPAAGGQDTYHPEHAPQHGPVLVRSGNHNPREHDDAQCQLRPAGSGHVRLAAAASASGCPAHGTRLSGVLPITATRFARSEPGATTAAVETPKPCPPPRSGVCLRPPLVVTEYLRNGSLCVLLQKARKQLESKKSSQRVRPCASHAGAHARVCVFGGGGACGV
jgi:hypothetical protein